MRTRARTPGATPLVLLVPGWRRGCTVPPETPSNFGIFLVRRCEFRGIVISYALVLYDVDGLLAHEFIGSPTRADNLNAHRLGRIVVFVTHEAGTGSVLTGAGLERERDREAEYRTQG